MSENDDAFSRTRMLLGNEGISRLQNASVMLVGLGAVGVVLPVLPTTPFLLLASFCLAKGSARFHRWFTGTNLYKKHLESFVENRTMTLKTKFSLLIPASCMLILAVLAMQNVYGRVFIIFLILFKYVYFFTRIRTVPAGQNRIPEMEG